MDVTELRVRQTRPEWCAAETDGALLLLFLTSVRSAWLPEIASAVREAAERQAHRRVPTMSVFRLDRRYPLDVGFDKNLDDLRASWREMAPFFGAQAVVLEFDGFLAFTMKTAITALGMFTPAEYPTSVHPTVVSAAAWLAPHVSGGCDVRHYVDAMNQLKARLGCRPP